MKRRGAMLLVFLLLCASAYVATGLYFVQADEQVVVRRFGALLPVVREPGAHFGLPWGLDRVDRVKAREVKRVHVGPLSLAGAAVGSAPLEFLTGDRNLINVTASVQYTISDPGQYLFHTAAVDPIVSSAAEAVLTGELSGEQVDRALTLGKQELGTQAASQLQTLVDHYGLGIVVRSVDIAAVQPPADVAEAFDKVISALRQRDQQINQAQSYANRTSQQAQADSQRIANEARSYRDSLTRDAEAEADRFVRLLVQYERAPELTARRLYLETMSETLPRFRSKLIIDSGSDLDLSILREEEEKK